VFWILDTAAAHAEDWAAVEEKFRLEGRMLFDWRRSWHRQQTELEGSELAIANDLTSRRRRGLSCDGGIECVPV
jgi:hypothetical protein